MAKCGTRMNEGIFKTEDSTELSTELIDEQTLFKSSLPLLYRMLENINIDEVLRKVNDAKVPVDGPPQSDDYLNSSIVASCGSIDTNCVVSPLRQRSKNEESIPEFCSTVFHRHPRSESNVHLLQVCCGDSESVYRCIDNRVREMDKIITNPANSLCKDVLDHTCVLKLPGPHTFNAPLKPVKLNSNRYTFDVLGLFVILVDFVYATNSVTNVIVDDVRTPLEFTQDVVKVIAVMKSAFPELFEELQKLVMYSKVLEVLRKVPFKWNRCMINVLEDLIVIPLNKINNESIEFKLLTVIIRKRAKAFFKQLEVDETQLTKLSTKFKNLLAVNFTKVYQPDIKQALVCSARNSLKAHRVKNLKYEICKEDFIRVLSINWRLYNC